MARKISKETATTAEPLLKSRLQELQQQLEAVNTELDAPEAKVVIDKLEQRRQLKHQVAEVESSIAEINPPPKVRSQSTCSV